jgi:DinB family protein
MPALEITRSVEDVLQQGLHLLDSLDAEAYTRQAPGGFGGSIGEHYRHVVEHFTCVLAGIREGNVNYDSRKRDRAIENDIEYARAVTEALIEDFRALPWDVFQKWVQVTYTVAYNTDEIESVPSNVSREIVFCVGHAVHHYAIIRLLCVQAEIAMPSGFGVAPSTLRHARTAQAIHSA